MAKHRLHKYWEVLFDDGTREIIEFRSCYYFYEQKDKYLISWLEQLILEKNIEAKPIEMIEKSRIVECEEYKIVIGI